MSIIYNAPGLGAENISVNYGENNAVRGLSLKVHDNKVYSFIGRQGVGKTPS